MKWNVSALFLALSGLLFQISFAQQVTLSQQGTEEIDRFFNDAVQQRKIPAVEAILVDKVKVLYHSVFGKRNTGEDIELQKGDLFDVASMTKPVTAIAAMILIEQGKINLNEPVSNYLPAFEELRVIQ